MNTSHWPDCLPRPGNLRFPRRAACSDWFEIYEINSQTFALLEPNHYEEAISFLITGARLAVVLDTGMGIGDIRREVQALTGLPLVVINSHYHNDHVGGDYQFEQVWAFDHAGEIAAIEAGISVEDIRYSIQKPHRNYPPEFDPGSYQIRPARVTRRLHHGESIDLGDRTLVVLHTPGHSPGSICLIDSTYRLLFTGDTYYPGMLFADNPDSDLENYEATVRGLVDRAADYDQLCTAHNEAVMPKEELLRLRSAFDQIRDGTVTARQAGSGKAYFDFGTFQIMVNLSDLAPAQRRLG